MPGPFPESLCHVCAAPPRYLRTARSVFIHCPVLKIYPPQPVRSCAEFRPRKAQASPVDPPPPGSPSGANRLPDIRPIVAGYDVLAAEYTRHVAGELEAKPFDREVLDRFAAHVRGVGPVGDLGCGPGHVGRYLFERGVDVFGVDVSAAMLKEACRFEIEIPYLGADMRALPVRTGCCAGLVAFYSIVHLAEGDLAAVFRELRRVLSPGGRLLLAFHIGNEVVHVDELWGLAVSMDFVFHATEAVSAALESAGFTITERAERAPYSADVEYQSRRAYLEAQVT